MEKILSEMNTLFTWVFFLEMVMKIIGLGFANYRKDSYNVFDAVIVIVSLLDWTLGRIPALSAGDSFLKAFRAFRMMRMIELARAWDALNEIWLKTVASFMDIGNFSLLLLLFMYIFALLGMELFAKIALVDENDNLIYGEEEI